MKARIKATGEIVEVSPYWTEIHTTNGGCYEMTEVDLINDTPDYWTRLEHTYAGMAMQQLVTIVNVGYEYVYEETAIIASNFAHALVEKMKQEREG